MARANQLRGDGGIYHITHRCHNRAFLFQFARDRDLYRQLLREHLKGFDLFLLDYCITLNHVHLLIDAAERDDIGRFMREVAGEFARAYNRRKKRMHAFWGDNYHATRVETGEYLWQCLCYIELNMVRCGVVAHPREWPWGGYQEIVGRRRRYRLIDLDRLCWRMRASTIHELGAHLERSLAEKIARDQLRREACWTESLAVGSKPFVESIRPAAIYRQETNVIELPEKMWSLREAPIPYGQKTGPKNGCKAVF
jgi:putative transposase